MSALEVVVGNSIADVDRFAGTLETFAAEHGLSDRVCMALSLALHEHLTNVVNYAFTDREPHGIRVRLEVSAGQVVAEVRDEGRAYNPLERPEVDTTVSIDDRPIGGLGVHFIRRLMDEVDYRRDGETNVLRMVRRWGD